jgi:hypothetical protein
LHYIHLKDLIVLLIWLWNIKYILSS